jgi:hypothetical protein
MSALLGENGVWRSSYKSEEYEQLLRELAGGGNMLRRAGGAYASYFGKAWDFLKPGFRALVPGMVRGITEFTGDRFAKPLTELGEEIFASSARRDKDTVYASSGPDPPPTTPQDPNRDIVVEINRVGESEVMVGARCNCSVQRNYAASIDCGWALDTDPSRCLKLLSELVADDLAGQAKGCPTCFEKPDIREAVIDLISAGLLESEDRLIDVGTGRGITIYASGTGMTDWDAEMEEEAATSALNAPPPQDGYLQPGITRGTKQAAKFRDLVNRGLSGESNEMADLLLEQ